MKKKEALIPPAPAESDAERFALALGAVMSTHRRWSHDHLGGLVHGLAAPDAQARRDLEQLIGADDRASLLEQLDKYLSGASAKELARVTADIAAMPVEKVGGWYSSSAYEANMRIFASEQRAALDALGDPSAYDVGRAALYLGLGYRAGWIARDEAFALLGRGARLARGIYGSWRAYANGYLAGRWVIAAHWNDEMKQMEAICTKLLADDKGPWRTIPWDTDVAALGEGVAIGGVWAPGAPSKEEPLTSIAVRAFADCAGCLRTLPIPAAAPALRCPVCGVETKVADMWGHVPALVLGDEDDDDIDEDDDDASEGPALATNLDDTIERIVFEARDPACGACGRAIAERAVREADGAIRCACGASIAVRAATTEHRAGDTRLLYFVGERPFAAGVVIGDAPHTFFALVGGKR
jgi:DNA-directed RNA polymerase subunit RPC12/RpoP